MALGIVFGAGQRLSASDLNTMVSQIDSLTAPGWTTYTPAWTSSGTAPAIGNGTLTGRYRRSANSDLVVVEGFWNAGSTTTFGTGIYSFSVPLNASASAQNRGAGSCYLFDFGTADRGGSTRFNTASTIGMVSGSVGDVSQTVPWTWANGDIMRWTLIYEPA